MSIKAPRLTDVIAGNISRLREDLVLTQAEFAATLQKAGLAWSRDQLQWLEAGKRASVTLSEFVLLLAVLQDIGIDDALDELLRCDGDPMIRVADGEATSMSGIRDLLAGGQAGNWISTLDEDEAGSESGPADLAARSSQVDERLGVLPNEVDVRVAHRLGVRPVDVVRTARTRWGRTLTEQRDHELGDPAGLTIGQLRARRGHITRHLERELSQSLEIKGADDDNEA